MELNSNYNILQLLSVVSLPGNSDEVVQGLLSQIILRVEQWPRSAQLQFLDELADGMSLADPYRAGLIAWTCGCLAESGHSTPRAREAILKWAEAVLQQSAVLQDRVCATLPAGILSSPEEFDERREAMQSVMLLEARAWNALKDLYPAITTVLIEYPEFRRRLRHLYEKCHELAKYHPTARHVANLIQIPHEEDFLILEPSQGRGLLALVDGIESMFQFLAVITQIFADQFDSNMSLSLENRDVAFGCPPRSINVPDHDPFQTKWTAFHWSAVREDGTLPIMNQDPVEEIIGPHRIFAEHDPWDPKPFAGYRVLLLQPTEVEFMFLWGRNYPDLRPSVKVKEVLGQQEVEAWTKRFSWISKMNQLGGRIQEEGDLHLQVAKGISEELTQKWRLGFVVRSIRRMVPIARQHWPPVPFELFEQLLRALNAVEGFAFAGGPVPSKDIGPLTSVVLDHAVRAERSNLVSPIVPFVAEAVHQLVQNVSQGEGEGGSDVVVLSCVQGAWSEAVRLARLRGHEPQHETMRVTLLKDRALLRELAAKGNIPYEDERRSILAEFWFGGRPDWWPLLPEYPVHGLEYEVVLSFAGEDRKYARKLAAALVRRGCRVFFDESERSELLGTNLTPLLQSIFRDRSLYCVVFVSAAYVEKPWTQVEWAAIREREAESKHEYVLPVRLDDTELPGLDTAVSYVDLRAVSASGFHELVAERVKTRIAQLLASSELFGHVKGGEARTLE